MTATQLAVLNTGSANLASVLAAFRRIGISPLLVSDGDGVRNAERLVLPGVGAFGAVMATLDTSGATEALVERITAGRPLLAICLGFQVLCAASSESPGATGLGILGATVERFPFSVQAPQLGWNRVTPAEPGGLVEPGYAYFANSYYVAEVDRSWHASHAEHGVRFVAAAERGSQLACQFHPELSGAWGASLLERWWARC